MSASKAAQNERLQRIERAFNALLDGNRAPVVVRSLMAEYGIGQTQAYDYVREATAEIYRKSDEKFDDIFEKHYKRLERLYQMCIRDGDKRTANQVVKQMADLFGLDAPKRTDITSGGEKIAQFVDVLGMPVPVRTSESKRDKPSDGVKPPESTE